MDFHEFPRMFMISIMDFHKKGSVWRAELFFAINSLAVLGSMLAKLANSAKTGISLSACLMGFGCRPSLGCLNGFAPSSYLYLLDRL